MNLQGWGKVTTAKTPADGPQVVLTVGACVVRRGRLVELFSVWRFGLALRMPDRAEMRVGLIRMVGYPARGSRWISPKSMAPHGER